MWRLPEPDVPDGRLRARSRRGRRVRCSAKVRATRASREQRVLSRMARHLGQPMCHNKHQRRAGDSNADAQTRRQCELVHVSRRHIIRACTTVAPTRNISFRYVLSLFVCYYVCVCFGALFREFVRANYCTTYEYVCAAHKLRLRRAANGSWRHDAEVHGDPGAAVAAEAGAGARAAEHDEDGVRRSVARVASSVATGAAARRRRQIAGGERASAADGGARRVARLRAVPVERPVSCAQRRPLRCRSRPRLRLRPELEMDRYHVFQAVVQYENFVCTYSKHVDLRRYLRCCCVFLPRSGIVT